MSVISGPCLIIRNNVGLVAKSGVTLGRKTTSWDAANAFAPAASKRRSKVMHEISFETDGRLTAAQVGELYAPLSMTPGSLLFGAADVPLHIFDINNRRQYTYHRTGQTKMADMFLGTTAQAIGALTYAAIPKSGVAVTDANSLVLVTEDVDFPGWADTYTEDEGEFTPDDAYSMGDAKSQSYACTWKNAGTGITGFIAFHGQQGVKVALGMQTSEVSDDAKGILDMLVQSLSASASMIPIGPTEAQMIAALNHQGAGAALGSEITLDGYTFEIVGTRLKVILSKAGLLEDSAYFGTDKIRQGEATWVSGAGTDGGAYVAPVALTIL